VAAQLGVKGRVAYRTLAYSQGVNWLQT